MHASFSHTVATALSILTLSTLASAATTTFPEGVIATGTQGVTNPPQPTLGTPLNQTSFSRLLSINSVDDFCLFGPPTVQTIGDSEAFEVAWCTKQRNNARLIPDGTITGVSFLKTDFYVQVMGYGDFTKLNIPFGDFGGELDPHGALGDGNPVGGNVTSNVTGSDQNFAEWMMYIDYNQFCLRVCTNANSTYNAAQMCWHELDEMGCQFVMPGNYNFNGTFETCEADIAYPPGWYPTATVNGTPQFSTFAQRFTGTANGVPYTVGDLVTPTTVASIPSSSNCVTTATISNGVNVLSGAGPTPAPGSGGASPSGSLTSSGNKGSSPTKSTGAPAVTGSLGSSNTNSTTTNSSPGLYYPGVTLLSVVAGMTAVSLFY